MAVGAVYHTLTRLGREEPYQVGASNSASSTSGHAVGSGAMIP